MIILLFSYYLIVWSERSECPKKRNTDNQIINVLREWNETIKSLSEFMNVYLSFHSLIFIIT